MYETPESTLIPKLRTQDFHPPLHRETRHHSAFGRTVARPTLM